MRISLHENVGLFFLMYFDVYTKKLKKNVLK